jgi:hypothetical protein
MQSHKNKKPFTGGNFQTSMAGEARQCSCFARLEIELKKFVDAYSLPLAQNVYQRNPNAGFHVGELFQE